MPQPQQEFLVEAMEYLGLTKNALAIKLNTSEYTVNAWLLPEDRQGYVELSEFIHEKINNLIQEKKSANFFHIHTGTFSEAVPGKYCEKYQFRFPTLYRSSSLRKQDNEPGRTGLPGIAGYTLSNLVDPEDIAGPLKFEPIHHLDAARDNAWVFINEHSSMNAVLGYWRAISHSNPNSISSRFKLYLFEDHLFSIYHIQKPEEASVNNIVFYQIDDNEFQIAMPGIRRKQFEDWSVIIDSDGNERLKDDIWKDKD